MSNPNIIITEDGKRYVIDLDEHIHGLEEILKALLADITLSEEDHYIEWVENGTVYIRPKIKLDAVKNAIKFLEEST